MSTLLISLLARGVVRLSRQGYRRARERITLQWVGSIQVPMSPKCPSSEGKVKWCRTITMFTLSISLLARGVVRLSRRGHRRAGDIVTPQWVGPIQMTIRSKCPSLVDTTRTNSGRTIPTRYFFTIVYKHSYSRVFFV